MSGYPSVDLEGDAQTWARVTVRLREGEVGDAPAVFRSLDPARPFPPAVEVRVERGGQGDVSVVVSLWRYVADALRRGEGEGERRHRSHGRLDRFRGELCQALDGFLAGAVPFQELFDLVLALSWLLLDRGLEDVLEYLDSALLGYHDGLVDDGELRDVVARALADLTAGAPGGAREGVEDD